ncbi:zinc transporter ZIP11 isoform X3 [Strongylocentrotus purpuratus]|uniref:Zinc transporter ZIP11 n=1 Tax=Strongylocentrotus purpuratus TaxID=7668 RepID=A0A7M7SY69_STRPU|nr:zinc transporter ZIP11 isoform X3 [Strongylocentrotus purpuratus]|eukprot:XP_794554.2 PREDICTED: zinc transporter ZIP11 isoform X2 [Strongylocentrotus purpuratus]
MLQGYDPVTQALLGTLFTWGLTAAGAALVFVFTSGKRKILDGSLGFAAGVMIAASYWSLLAPAIEIAETNGYNKWSFVPAAIGFILGALFVYAADVFLPMLGISSPNVALALQSENKLHAEYEDDLTVTTVAQNADEETPDTSTVTQRRKPGINSSVTVQFSNGDTGLPASPRDRAAERGLVTWKRILLLIIAITIHNIPEGLAVGVGFGAIGKTPSATFENARNLAIGIGIQNFPEGLAVSLPLRGSGFSIWRSFWYGQLSGMVEPIAGVIGALAVTVAEPILPYALAFAAGAMIYVVVDDIIPEAHTSGNGRLASCGAIVGFVVMMSLDVGLG